MDTELISTPQWLLELVANYHNPEWRKLRSPSEKTKSIRLIRIEVAKLLTSKYMPER